MDLRHRFVVGDPGRRLVLGFLDAVVAGGRTEGYTVIAQDNEPSLALYRRCGAAYDVRRLAGAPREPGGEPLSDREREIAALAARGRQNLEIARELSITHKTVEKHLASAYRKLGITSRGQLGDAVGRE